MFIKLVKNVIAVTLFLPIGSSLFGARPMSRQEEQQINAAIAASLREQGAAAQPAAKRPEQMSFEEQMAYALRESGSQAAKPAKKLPAQMSFDEQMAYALAQSQAEEKAAGARKPKPVQKPAQLAEDDELTRAIALSLAESAEQEKKGAEQKIVPQENAAEQARLNLLKTQFLKQVNPPKDCYRPTIIAGDKEGHNSLKMELACLLTGRKPVWTGDDVDLRKRSKDVRKILEQSTHRLDLLKAPILSQIPNQYMVILYSKGNDLARLHGQLLLKNLSDYWQVADENWRLKGEIPHRTNSYLNGFLLGYPIEDIIEFYKYNSGGPRLTEEEAMNALEYDKRAAIDWVAENSPDIEKWIQEKEREGVVKVDKW